MEMLKRMSENGNLGVGKYWEAGKISWGTELHMLFTKYYQGDKIGEVGMSETFSILERQEMCR